MTAAAEGPVTFGYFFYRWKARLLCRWGSSSAQGTGGRVRAPAPTAYPKVRLIFCRARCPHRAVPGRPRCAAPTAKTDRARWFGKPRRIGGTAPAPIFHKARAQWPGLNGRRPLRFCAPEMFCPPQGVTPVNGVRGKRSYGPRRSGAKRSRSPSAASPAILKVNCPEGAREGGLGHWFLSHRWERNSPPVAPSSVTASPCHLPPRGKAYMSEL